MSDASAAYAACVRALYASKVLGAAMALALLEVVRNESDRYAFWTLLQLKNATKARLRPYLVRLGISLDENVELSDVGAVVRAYTRTSSLREFAGVMRPVVRNCLSRLEEIARTGPAADRDVLESMVRHEAAILQWFVMESEGRTEGSLDGMIRELHYPLPAF